MHLLKNPRKQQQQNNPKKKGTDKKPTPTPRLDLQVQRVVLHISVNFPAPCNPITALTPLCHIVMSIGGVRALGEAPKSPEAIEALLSPHCGRWQASRPRRYPAALSRGGIPDRSGLLPLCSPQPPAQSLTALTTCVSRNKSFMTLLFSFPLRFWLLFTFSAPVVVLVQLNSLFIYSFCWGWGRIGVFFRQEIERILLFCSG